jgi:hypothetical protein
MQPESVCYSVIAEYETDVEVRGNALASGDDAEDKDAEREIIERLERGDVWAWASVKVVASWGDFKAESDWLGACSYEDEESFREPGGYFDDMKREALERLQDTLAGELAKATEDRIEYA